MIYSKQIKVGDVIELRENERVPADVVLLANIDKSENVFIRTDQLDGESDWKSKKAINYSKNTLQEFNISLSISPPNNNLHEFNGSIHLQEKDSEQKANFFLNLENTIWANSVITKGPCRAVVIYTGIECKFRMNASKPRFKTSILDSEIYYYNFYLFIILLIVTLASLILIGFSSNILLNMALLVKFIMTFNHLLPLSLKTNLEAMKTINSTIIDNNSRCNNAQARNMNIPEQLGRINYIFTDKTGTLTSNIMIVKSFITSDDTFIEVNLIFKYL